MKIDTPTVIAITILNVLIMLMILLHARITRKTYPGFDVWLAGTALWFVGSVISYVFRGTVSPFWYVVVGNGLMQSLPVLCLDGINRFYNIPYRWWRTPLNLVTLTVSIGLLHYFTFISDNISARGVVISACYSIFFSRVAVEPLLAPQVRRQSIQWLLSVSILPVVVVNMLRIPFFLAHPELRTFADVIAKDRLLMLVMLLGDFVIIVINYSYLSLTSDRMEGELRASEHRIAAAYDSERESRETQERFLDMIAHEYRTPAAIIQANLDILDLKSAGQNISISQELTKMHRAVVRLVEIFESAKRRDGLDQLTIRPVLEETTEVEPYLHEVLDVAVDLWGERFACNKRADVKSRIRIDRQMFRTALLNLLDNAVKYSPPDSAITLMIENRMETMNISVVNSACSELPPDMSNLVDKYQRGNNSTGTSGTGVGLYLVRRIIEQHGGSIRLEAIDKKIMLVTLSMPCDQTEGCHAT